MADYVDPQRFAELIELAQVSGKACNELADMGGRIGRELIKRFHFQGIGRDEAYSLGALTLCTKFNKFKTGRGKPFSFFTTIILNEFRATWRAEDRYTKLIERYANHVLDRTKGTKSRRNKTLPKDEHHKE